MGQGLNTKVAQIVAEVFQVDLERIQITATNTGKVPNTSPTAASSGTDLNGKAAEAAATTINSGSSALPLCILTVTKQRSHLTITMLKQASRLLVLMSSLP